MELADNLLQLCCVSICGLYACISAVRQRSNAWLFLALFYLSFWIGIVYWALYLALFQCAPQVFCVSELNWTTSYIFLSLRLLWEMPPEERRCKSGVFPWCFPAFSFAMCVFFWQRGSYLENILMGSAIAVCGFYGAKGLLFARRKGQKGKAAVCLATLLFYGAEYLLWLSSYLWIDDFLFNPYFITDTLLLNPALIFLTIAQYREGKGCLTI